MLLTKSFTVPVEPVVKPAEATTSQKPFFDPGASTSSLAKETSGPSLVKATGEAVDEMETATQPLEAPGAGTATQPVQAHGSVPDVQPSGEGDLSAASDSEGDQQSVTGSLSDENYRYGSPDRPPQGRGYRSGTFRGGQLPRDNARCQKLYGLAQDSRV